MILKLEDWEHIIRMEEEMIPKKVRNGKLNSLGKPRTRWKDDVQRDALLILVIRGWTRQAGHTEEWRRLLSDATAKKGL